MAGPYAPWIIYGTLSGGSNTGGTIYATNLTNSETITESPDANGNYVIDCANFPSGYVNGDVINVTYSDGTMFAQMKYGAISKTSRFDVFETDIIVVE